jgi:hypothetical protein
MWYDELAKDRKHERANKICGLREGCLIDFLNFS